MNEDVDYIVNNDLYDIRNKKLIYKSKDEIVYEIIELIRELNIEEIDIQNKYFDHSLDLLPDCISSIYICNNCIFSKKFTKFPKNINRLVLNFSYNEKINFPKTLTNIVLSNEYKYLLNDLPLNLISLYLSSKYPFPLDDLPINLEILSISGNDYGFELDKLPINLKRLLIFGNYNFPLDDLPPNLLYLKLKDQYYKFPLNNLPDSIISLGFYDDYCHNTSNSINITRLPLNCKNIYITKYGNLAKKLLETLKKPIYHDCFIELIDLYFY